MASLKGSIPITIIGDIEPAHHKRKNCFKVDTPGRTFLFATDQERELKQWIAALMAAKIDYTHSNEAALGAQKSKQGNKPTPLTTDDISDQQQRDRASTTANLPTKKAPGERATVQDVFPAVSQSERVQRPARISSKTKEQQNAKGTHLALKRKGTGRGISNIGIGKGREGGGGGGKRNNSGKAKKAGEDSEESEGEGGYGTVIVKAKPPLTMACEFREYYLGIPPMDELRKKSKRELQEISDRVDEAMKREVARVSRGYLVEKKAILEVMEKKEMDQVQHKYAVDRHAILEAIKQKSNEAAEK